ncbi:hypothetical protein [Corynebacterium doosanense]|uniref:Uncharacterized protein n=1 Tax=Corynebacterium doosanense CAU 212 = DSM 45436 TaxID=558173 RepID=A0A097ID54_9CORY|nr:hypothetical protein [Corynebacterium doosanense]AIT60062.1 hypothetical protein CDOO_01175 [Corynebacterium doosanense CAU 212 = DSM 45436]
MTSHSEPARVIDLGDARARRAAAGRVDRTVVLQVSNVRADGETHRHIGVTDSLQLRDLRDVLLVSFGIDEEGARAPWHFCLPGTDADTALDPDEPLHRYLGASGDSLIFHLGLWQFTVVSSFSWPRDRGTPWALCVGGSGRFGEARFDIAAINAALTGTDTTQEVLSHAAAPVTSLIERSRISDLVPLLQALDLSREPELSPEVRRRMRDLPVEEEPAQVDAFWALALGLAALSDDETADAVAETVMEALGWVEDDGSPISGRSARELCRDSLSVLEELRMYGPEALGPLDRLEFFRGLLRADG